MINELAPHNYLGTIGIKYHERAFLQVIRNYIFGQEGYPAVLGYKAVDYIGIADLKERMQLNISNLVTL